MQPPPAAAAASAAAGATPPAAPGTRAVVVGGGWAGFGAALALAKAGAQVTLLDASESPGGLSSAFATPGGRLVEPGVKGFWYSYSNIEALVAELGIPDPFTPFTRSSFWSPGGLQVESPVFQDLPRLPTPLGSFVHTSALFRGLGALDRASALPLVGPLLEHDLDQEAYSRFDSMSAYELFRAAGVSRELYVKFLEPMLLVTLFATPEELSAAAALGALYYFALASQPSFDVRWCRGPIGSTIFQPLVRRLEQLGVRVLGGQRVELVSPPGALRGGAPGEVVARDAQGRPTRHAADAVVLAAGVPALQRLVAASPWLAAAPDLRGVLGVRCTDVLAVRLWLNRKLQLRTPSNVLAGFEPRSVGGTLFALDELQDAYKAEPYSTLELDFYNAGPLLPLSDDELVRRALDTYLAPALPRGAPPAASLGVRDASVLRFRGAATCFGPGSDGLLPPLVPSVRGVYVAGDCVRQGPGTHGCKGLSQEKAWVTGLQAGNRAAAELGLAPAARVLPVEPDEPHVAAAKELLRTQRRLGQALGSLSSAGRRPRQQQQQPAAAARAAAPPPLAQASGAAAGGGRAAEPGGGERSARAAHDLQALLREEMAEQVASQDLAARTEQKASAV